MGKSQQSQQFCAPASKADGKADCPGDAVLPRAQSSQSHTGDFQCPTIHFLLPSCVMAD